MFDSIITLEFFKNFRKRCIHAFKIKDNEETGFDAAISLELGILMSKNIRIDICSDPIVILPRLQANKELQH